MSLQSSNIKRDTPYHPTFSLASNISPKHFKFARGSALPCPQSFDLSSESFLGSPRSMQMAAGMVHDEGCSFVGTSPLQAFTQMSLSSGIGSSYPSSRELKSEERGLSLIQLLVNCANHVACGDVNASNMYLDRISHLASPDGDSMQRIAAYFSHALALRILKPWTGVDKALNSTRINSVLEGILVGRLFFDLCPFLKLLYLVMNQAIIEALEREMVVHIIDLNSSDPAQWINLLQLLRDRPEGPPLLKITGIHEQKEVLDLMAHSLKEEAEKLDFPFQFVPINSSLENLDIASLNVNSGVALVINSVLQLHTVLAADDDMYRRTSPCEPNGSGSANLQRVLHMKQRTLGEWLEKDLPPYYPYSGSGSASSPLYFNPALKMTSFLNSLWGLSPKLMVIAEQESNHNASNLVDRLLEALKYYANVFDCLDVTVQRAYTERQKLEKNMFGEEIRNIIASDGLERRERHEKLEKWAVRMEMSGFGKVSLSYNGLLNAGTFLRSQGYEGYNLTEEEGCVLVRWKNTPLYSVSAWRG
ncbi:hypothetical protein MLD38_038233 [Melastoma candidum]|uniref:Uncharacterized protein n=1 Tax=Melastoma candidum TaxID=119954 RepID=A0ACB9KZG2_9MYRT|nr:hypothetical protein MLD38_038233 [Melastoma candidum]